MISQYANSPKYVTLSNGLVSQFDNYQTIKDWYDVIFNIRTASGIGLDWWGKILNQSRRITYTDSNNQQVDIFLQGEITFEGVTYSAQEIENLYRTILIFRAVSDVGNATIPSLTSLLNVAFSNRGKLFVEEIGVMQIGVVFKFYVNDLEKAIFSSGIFPKPTGVGMNFYYLPDGAYFGFFVDGAVSQPYSPFDNQPFYNYG